MVAFATQKSMFSKVKRWVLYNLSIVQWRSSSSQRYATTIVHIHSGLATQRSLSMWTSWFWFNVPQTFEESDKNTTFIIFIYNINSIAPKREKLHGAIWF